MEEGNPPVLTTSMPDPTKSPCPLILIPCDSQLSQLSDTISPKRAPDGNGAPVVAKPGVVGAKVAKAGLKSKLSNQYLKRKTYPAHANSTKLNTNLLFLLCALPCELYEISNSEFWILAKPPKCNAQISKQVENKNE